MPLYTYQCSECGNRNTKLRAMADRDKLLDCDVCQTKESMSFQLPTSVNSITYDTPNKHKGIKTRKGLEKQMKSRMKQHHRKYEMDEIIDKHGLDAAKGTDWIKERKKL